MNYGRRMSKVCGQIIVVEVATLLLYRNVTSTQPIASSG